jgi:hypothetical protein
MNEGQAEMYHSRCFTFIIHHSAFIISGVSDG